MEALIDPVTGLANSTLLLHRLDAALARRQALGGHVVGFHIEMNNLSYVHDQLGLDAANAVLLEISRRLLSLVRNEDTVARIGESELVVAVSLHDEAAIAALSDRLQDAFSGEFVFPDRAIHLWATFGSVDAQDSESASELLERLEQEFRFQAPETPSTWALSVDRSSHLG